MLVPVIGVLQIGMQGHADRYTYLPQIGLYLLVTWTVGDFVEVLAVSAKAFGNQRNNRARRFRLEGTRASSVLA
jgi:hypothetical protein